MRKTFNLVLCALAAIWVSFRGPGLEVACGPYFPMIIFTNTLHPDPPLDMYAMGNLGVIQPSYGSTYLYVAYRSLTNEPYSPALLGALLSNGSGPLEQGRSVPGILPGPQPPAVATADWLALWQRTMAFKQVPQTSAAYGYGPGPGGVYRQLVVHEPNHQAFYTEYLNCPQGAFRTALSTLQARRQQFGASSPSVEDWISAQHKVFENCGGDQAEIPAALPSSAPALARADRDYQIAAAHFYAGDFDPTITEFRAIADDASSPWHTIAPYLVARALVRKATLNAGFMETNRPVLAEAEAQLNSILANPRLAAYQSTARKLRGFVEFRLHPRRRIVELANNLTSSAGDPNLRQDLIDFSRLFGRMASWGAYPNPEPPNFNVYSELSDVRSQSDLLDWMFTMHTSDAAAYQHSYERWQATHSTAWLVAALTMALPGSPHVEELQAAADRVQFRAAFASVVFHNLRLMVLEGKTAQARQRLASRALRALGTPDLYAPPSTVNLFRALRFELAQNFNELLNNAPRSPATVTDTSISDQMPTNLTFQSRGTSLIVPGFDGDALQVLNWLLPVNMLAEAVRRPELPEGLRHEIALAAWTRAVLMGNVAVARSLTVAVETFVPLLTANVRAYEAASNEAERRIQAALTFLRFPGLRPYITTPVRDMPVGAIDGMRDNWWSGGGPCQSFAQYWPTPGAPGGGAGGVLPPWPQLTPSLQAIYPHGQIPSPAFLTSRQRAEAARERQRLLAIGAAPDYLSAQVIAWAKAHRRDPRVPEALALAVRSTRVGCVDQRTGSLSKGAFDLLHQRYPNSSWAKTTPYWFKM